MASGASVSGQSERNNAMNSKPLCFGIASGGATKNLLQKSTLTLVMVILGVSLNVGNARGLPLRHAENVSHDALKARAAAAVTSATCSNTIQTTPLASTVPDSVVGNNTPDDLVGAILGPGVTFFNVTFTGVTNSAGAFSDSAAVFGITNGIVLSSGSIDNIKGPDRKSVV